MVKRWISVFIGAVLCITFARQGWALSVDYVADQIKNLQKQVKSCEGKFTLLTFSSDEADTSPANFDKRNGTFLFKSPSFWRIETYELETAKQRYLVICDSTNLWQYFPGKKVVDKKSIGNLSAAEQIELVQNMTGKSPFIKMVESERKSVFSVKENTANQTWELELVLNDYSSQRIPFEYDKIKMSFSKKDGLLREMAINNEGASVYIISFYDMGVNIPISDDRFIFQAPEGVEINALP